jgi:hypothetical protein
VMGVYKPIKFYNKIVEEEKVIRNDKDYIKELEGMNKYYFDKVERLEDKIKDLKCAIRIIAKET